MNLGELMEMLEIDSPEEFEYFENMADLIETEEDIEEGVLCQLFSKANIESVAIVIDSYFEDVLDSVPDGYTDMYTLIDSIRLSLRGLIKSEDEDSGVLRFVEELLRFKRWYTLESEVECVNIETTEAKVLTLRDGLTLARMEKLDEDEYDFDFTQCFEYEIDEYIMDLASLGNTEEYEDRENEDLINQGYIYDDEMKG